MDRGRAACHSYDDAMIQPDQSKELIRMDRGKAACHSYDDAMIQGGRCWWVYVCVKTTLISAPLHHSLSAHALRTAHCPFLPAANFLLAMLRTNRALQQFQRYARNCSWPTGLPSSGADVAAAMYVRESVPFQDLSSAFTWIMEEELLPNAGKTKHLNLGKQNGWTHLLSCRHAVDWERGFFLYCVGASSV